MLLCMIPLLLYPGVRASVGGGGHLTWRRRSFAPLPFRLSTSVSPSLIFDVEKASAAPLMFFIRVCRSLPALIAAGPANPLTSSSSPPFAPARQNHM